MTRARILIADDSPEHRTLLAQVLGPLDLEVQTVDDGAHLIQALAHDGPFDLIITDILMPWLNGLEAVRMVRASGIRTPVLFVSALGADELAARAPRLPRVRLLRKPCRFSAIRMAVTEMLGLES